MEVFNHCAGLVPETEQGRRMRLAECTEHRLHKYGGGVPDGHRPSVMEGGESADPIGALLESAGIEDVSVRCRRRKTCTVEDTLMPLAGTGERCDAPRSVSSRSPTEGVSTSPKVTTTTPGVHNSRVRAAKLGPHLCCLGSRPVPCRQSGRYEGGEAPGKEEMRL